jgi:hypothetical protein
MDLLLHSTIPQMSAGDQAWLPLVRHAILSSLELPYFPFLLKPYISQTRPARTPLRTLLARTCVCRASRACFFLLALQHYAKLARAGGRETIDNERATPAR